MEHYQSTINRTMQTIAVINAYVPTLTVAGTTSAGLTTLITALETSASTRDTTVATSDQAVNAENLASLFIGKLDLALPQAATAELDDEKPVEAGLADLFSEAFGITPRTTELRLRRGKKVVAALVKINSYLAAQVRPVISVAGKTVGDLTTAMNGQPALEQAVENTAADVTSARTNFDTADHVLDRLNKRFYKKLQAEARSNAALAAALPQIDTETDNLPGTLSIQSVLQGGADQLHILVSYVNGTGSDADERLLDWMVVGVDADFAHTVAVDLSGNALGPFLAGQTVKMRTRTVNTHGTRTSATRTLVVQAPG